jgi:hypothetical protein
MFSERLLRNSADRDHGWNVWKNGGGKMRWYHCWQDTMFGYEAPEARVAELHPLRAMRAMVNQSLAALDVEFEALYLVTVNSSTSTGAIRIGWRKVRSGG